MLPLTTTPECEIDARGQITLSPSGNAHPPSCLSGSAATSCGPAARWPVARERLGPWRERPASPKARYGLGARWRFTSRLSPSTGRSRTNSPWREGRPAPLRGAGPHARRSHRWRHGGRPRPGSTRRTTLPVQHGRAVRSLPHYVGPDVSVSHPSQRRSSTGRFILNRWIRASRRGSRCCRVRRSCPRRSKRGHRSTMAERSPRPLGRG